MADSTDIFTATMNIGHLSKRAKQVSDGLVNQISSESPVERADKTGKGMMHGATPDGNRMIAVRTGTTYEGEPVYEYYDNVVTCIVTDGGALMITISHNDIGSVECYAKGQWERYTMKSAVLSYIDPEPDE